MCTPRASELPNHGLLRQIYSTGLCFILWSGPSINQKVVCYTHKIHVKCAHFDLTCLGLILGDIIVVVRSRGQADPERLQC